MPAALTFALVGALATPGGALRAQAAGGTQTIDTTLVTADYNALKTPESPAFAILGISPTSISRPTSPRGFAVSFLDALKSADSPSLVPSTFAVEVNPYWWSPRPNLTFTEYRNQGIASLYRNLTVSFASADSTIPAAVGGTPEAAGAPPLTFRRLGLGLKTTVYGKQTMPDCVQELDRLLAGVTEAIASAVADSIAAAVAAGDLALATDPVRLEQMQQAIAQGHPMVARINALREPCTKKAANLTGFAMDIAGAAVFGYTETAGNPLAPVRAANDGMSSVGAWLTPSLLGESFSAIGVARVLWSELETDDAVRMTDLGARGVYSSGRYAASLEGLWRKKSGGTDAGAAEYRMAVVFDVRVSEDLWLTSSFGKGFQEEGPGGLIALANLQWAFGKPQPGLAVGGG